MGDGFLDGVVIVDVGCVYTRDMVGLLGESRNGYFGGGR